MKSCITILLAALAGVACATTPEPSTSLFEASSLSSVEVEKSFFERADVNHDSFLDSCDMLMVLAAYGNTKPKAADINEDGVIDDGDAFLILHLYSTICEGY